MPENIGQFLVVGTRGVFAVLIRLLTRSPVNHAAVRIGEDRYIESRMRGARITDFAGVMHGAKKPYVVFESRFDLTQEQQARLVGEAEALVGTGYNFLDILALGLLCLGLRWDWLIQRAQRQDRDVCSQLVDVIFHNAGLDLYKDQRPSGLVTPLSLLLYLACGNTPVATRNRSTA